MADNNSFLLRIITPDRIFYENQVKMVEFNTTEGEIGVLPGHIPLTVIVKPRYSGYYGSRRGQDGSPSRRFC